MAPSRSDQQERKLISAPAPTRMTSVLSARVHDIRVWPEIEKGSERVPGSSLSALRRMAIKAAKAAAMPRILACEVPAAEPLWMVRMVWAVAVPVGKASASRLMSWRLMGMAANTPRAAMTANQTMVGMTSGRTGVSIKSAPNAAMLPPPVM